MSYRMIYHTSSWVENLQSLHVEARGVKYNNRTCSEYHPIHGCITGDNSPSIPS